MLREQDDPNTKIGKANDDSVLFPKRASKMNLFGNNDLGDIAEVASITDAIRPPFAKERSESYSSADGYGTDDDGKSIMSRSRQVKGNKFFANRQKVYMIPSGGSASMRELRETPKPTDNASRSMGKVVYDDDVNMSKFNFSTDATPVPRTSDEKLRADRSSDDHERRGSLQNSDNNSSKRETSSSTNSGPPERRASTAATSVASQGASPMHGPPANGTGFPFNKQSFSTVGQDRATKGKRLYGQGIDQQIYEQQSSALNRLNSIQRPYGFAQSRSATNLNDRFNKTGQPYSTNNFNTMSPVPGSSNSLAGFDFGTPTEGSRSNSRTNEYANHTSPTMSRPMSPTSADPTLAAALEPNDIGKATASGAFNKPKTPYSDEQFARRQMQLQEGRESPASLSFSKPGAYNNLVSRDRNGSLASQTSAHSTGSQSRSQLSQAAPPPLQYRKQESVSAGDRPVNGAYLASHSGSELGSEPTSPIDLALLKSAAQSAMSRVIDPSSRHRKYEHDDQHPAFNTRLELSEEDRISEISQALPLQDTDNDANAINASSSNIIDSPTLPVADEITASSGGLNDWIRGHLRNVSNTSSVYPNTPPRQSHEFFLDGQDAATSGNAAAVSSNPLDAYVLEEEQVPEDPLSARARRILEQANQLKNAPSKPYEVLGGVGASKVQQVLGGEAPRRSNETSRNVALQEVLKGHSRGASTETQKEREDFANELADRRKQVQDNLKSIVVEESRSESPLGTRNIDNSPARGGPLGLLKKASRSSIVGRNDNPSKAMKMLGYSSNPTTAPTTPQPSVISPEGFAGTRPVLNSDIRQRVPKHAEQQFGKVRPGNGPSFRDRSMGAERRAGLPRGTSPAPNNGPDRTHSARQPSPNPNGYNFPRSHSDNAANPQTMNPTTGRTRKCSPPGAGPRNDGYFDAAPHAARSASAQGHYSPALSNNRYQNGSYFPNQSHSPNPQGNHLPPAFIESPRASPVIGTSPVRGTPPTELPPNAFRNGAVPPALRGQQPRKRSINKDEISNPIFQSGTSTVITVDLPNGASLANGMDEVRAHAPPVPPINPRRRKAAPTQNLFTSFVNKSSNNLSALSTPSSAATSPHSGTPMLQDPPHHRHEEKSTFSSDENEPKPHRARARLRKSSSDGGNMAARARHQALKEMEQMKMPGTPVYATGDNGSRMF